MRSLLTILALMPACSTRHIEGYDRFTEVCIEGTSLTLFELGNLDWDCVSPAAAGGKLSLRLTLPTPLKVPLRLSVMDLESASWCPELQGDCLEIVSGDLELTAYEEGIATGGSYQFTLSDGSEVEGLINAQYCEPSSDC